MVFQGQVKTVVLRLRENNRDQVQLLQLFRDVLQRLFLGIDLPLRSRGGYDAGGSRRPEHVSDLEIKCVVGLVSGAAVDHHRGKDLPAACESSHIIFQLNEVGW